MSDEEFLSEESYEFEFEDDEPMEDAECEATTVCHVTPDLP